MRESLNESIYMQLATAYFNSKPRKPYYEIVALNEDNLSEVIYLEDFSDEEYQALMSLRERYGMDNYIQHLDEVFTDPDELHDLSCGQEIVRVNLDNPCYQYEFGRHELVNNQLSRNTALVVMFDDNYISLLALMLSDPKMNMNKLQFADSFLYNTIYSQIIHMGCDDGFYMGDYPFLVTMDEVLKDAEAIRAQHPELNVKGSMGYYCNI